MLRALGACALLATMAAGDLGDPYPEGSKRNVGMCLGDCAGKGQPCYGTDANGAIATDRFKYCCDEGFYCYTLTYPQGPLFYSECRTPDTSPSYDGWTGPYICSPCGVRFAKLGELTNSGCKPYDVGYLTLEDCAHECASQGYIACDTRFEYTPGAGTLRKSCYGYLEDAPGNCGPRNSNTSWMSWFVCPEGNPECGPYSAVFGELEAPGCKWDYLGDYTLEGCSHECAVQGYVGCGRFAVFYGDYVDYKAKACYGYWEVSPGDCGDRNSNHEFISWLLCD